MRTFRHWNLRYARDRLTLLAFSLSHPGAPWLAPDAIRFLEEWLRPNHVGFEWGAGRSTIWLSSRVGRLTSIEHDQTWYQRVQQMLLAGPRNNVELRHVPIVSAAASRDSGSTRNDYVAAIGPIPDASLDFVLVDGVSNLRDACALAAIPKIRPGGILIIDDIHRYLPSESRAPLALPATAEPLTPTWIEAAARLESWNYNGCTSGVTDTGVWTRK